MTPEQHAEKLLHALEGASWATLREDRVRIVTGHFREAMTGVEIRKARAECTEACTPTLHSTSCLRAPERREIADRAAEYRRKWRVGT